MIIKRICRTCSISSRSVTTCMILRRLLLLWWWYVYYIQLQLNQTAGERNLQVRPGVERSILFR